MIVRARKTYRIIVGLIFPVLYYFSPDKLFPIAALMFFLGLVTALEIARKASPVAWDWICKRSKGVFKEKSGPILGETFFLLSTLFCIVFLDRSIAICTLLYLTFGDAASTAIGIRYGTRRFSNQKSIQGSFAFLVVSLIVGSLVRLAPGIYIDPWVVVIGAVVATVAEALPLPIDDNFTVAAFSGMAMEICARLFVSYELICALRQFQW
jgi:diacylglycerol kinase (CTP)